MRTKRVPRQEGDEKNKVLNLQWIIRAHSGERAGESGVSGQIGDLSIIVN
jgi:hypothetical protein